MTIRELRIFIAVVETGKMGLAAKKLYIAQPTVSHVISEIESTYGVKLFERLAKRLYITPEGERLLGYARHIVALFDEMERSLKNSSNQVLLKMGATITVGSCVLTSIINRLEEKHPNVQAQVYVDNTHIIEEMILTSKLDLALVEGSVTSKDLLVHPVIRDELVLICGMQHPLVSKKVISIEELAGQAFIVREQGSGTRERFEELIQSCHIEIYPKWTCHCSDAILTAVAGGQGLAVISKMLVREMVQSKKLHIIEIDGVKLDRSFSLVYHKDKFISQPMQSLIDTIGSF